MEIRSISVPRLINFLTFLKNDMGWVIDIILEIIFKSKEIYRWLRFGRFKKVVRNLSDNEKHILSGLYNSPPLPLSQALQKSLGTRPNLADVFSARSGEIFEKNLTDKQLILPKEGGYILSEGAEYAISKGVFKGRSK